MENSNISTQHEVNNEDNEIHFLCKERKIVAFRIPDKVERSEEDEEDEFYELTLNEVKMIYKHLQETRLGLVEAPLLTKKHREEQEKERAEAHKVSLVRVEFPDRTVLQGVFSPEDTVATLVEVVTQYLAQPSHITLFTAPPRVVLSPEWSLRQAGLVPTGKVYCKAGEELEGKPYLKEDIIFSSHLAAEQAAQVARTKDSSKKSPKPSKKEPPKKKKDPASLLKYLSKPSLSNTKTS